QTSEGTELIRLRRHLNALEDLPQLPRAVPRGIAALETRELATNAVEIDTVAAGIAARRAHTDFTPRELLRDDLRDLANAIVVGVLPDVEHFPAHCVFGCNQREIGRASCRER